MEERFHLDVFESDLALLPEKEFWEVWRALGKIIWFRNHTEQEDIR